MNIIYIGGLQVFSTVTEQQLLVVNRTQHAVHNITYLFRLIINTLKVQIYSAEYYL